MTYRRGRREILRILTARGASNPRVFGSVARGTADEKSDLDLLVDLSEPRPRGFHHVGPIVELEEDLGPVLGRRVHVTELGDPSPELAASVERDAVPL
jgi:uncharacterized protein